MRVRLRESPGVDVLIEPSFGCRCDAGRRRDPWSDDDSVENVEEWGYVPDRSCSSDIAP